LRSPEPWLSLCLVRPLAVMSGENVIRRRIEAKSPLRMARIAGVLYLIVIVTAGFAEGFVRDKLVTSSNAPATASNLLTHETLYRAGGAADLINLVCDTALALLFYELLKSVSSSLALLAAFFRLVHVAILSGSTLFHFAALTWLRGAPDMPAFGTPQLQQLGLASLKLHGLGYNICLVFFGFACLVMAYLIWKSTFLPRILGVLLAIAGSGYLINSFLVLLSPSLASHLFPWLLLPGFPAELALALWLAIKGVNASKWDEMYRQAASA
jgi:uncharacterized protein DUF4386